jgi:hypothetical protein
LLTALCLGHPHQQDSRPPYPTRDSAGHFERNVAGHLEALAIPLADIGRLQVRVVDKTKPALYKRVDPIQYC